MNTLTKASQTLGLRKLLFDKDFDWQFYIELYEDLSGFKTEADAEEHWKKYGQSEQRVASVAGALKRFSIQKKDFPLDFDWQQYLDLNPDLKGGITNQAKAVFHYIEFGIKEGRRYKEQDDFDWQFYLWYNKDLENIQTESEARKHWKDSGEKSGRIGLPKEFYEAQGVNLENLPQDFDFNEYLALKPDLSQEGIQEKWHVIAHFLKRAAPKRSIYSFNTWGLSLEKNTRYEEAIKAFEMALKFNPRNFEAQMNLTRCLICKGESKRAIALYRKISQQQTFDRWNTYDFNRSLSNVLKEQLTQILEDSSSLITQHRDVIDVHSKELAKSGSSVGREVYQKLHHSFDQMLEQYMSMTARVNALRLMHRVIESNFDIKNFIAFPVYAKPTVSVIIPVYNKVDYTIRCLKSLVQNVSSDLAIEVIVVNDCSADETKEYLEEIDGLVLVNNIENLGFIHSCNAGADASKGQFLYFLNNDTEVMPNAIERLVEVFTKHPEAGAVGSKLIYPSGELQEAGGIIWKDASGWNYGRNENPYDPKYNFLRSVDYCSGASLLVKRETFEVLNGFERDFAPAYYEDTDLCFAVRHKLGLEVFYQPKSEIIHYEGVSSGTSISSGVKRFQVLNSKKFQDKWAQSLKKHPTNLTGYEDAHRAARRFQGYKTVLVIDSYLPYYDKESGSRRLFQILKIFKELKYHIIFLPNDMLPTEPYVSELQAMQIEVLYTCSGYGNLPEEQLRERLPLIDVAWVCRPDLMNRYLPILREAPKIKIVYDTIDLHYLRMKRELELGLVSKKDEQSMSWIDMQALELKMAMQAEMTLTVTPTEKEILQKQGVKNIEVIPNIHVPYEGIKPSFEERAGILFIGGYNHPPNVDAVRWLCREIMPQVWQELPDVSVTLLGSHPSDQVKDLTSERVIVPGYVTDVSSYFLENRIFVAPLRYGAGMKGKIGQSLEFGLPLISTAIGVEGMNLVSGRDSIEANTAGEFVKAILKLYRDKYIWEELAKHSSKAIEFYSPSTVKQVITKVA